MPVKFQSPFLSNQLETERALIRSLVWRYIVALSLLAIMVTFVWVTMGMIVAKDKDSSLIINISGRQRMLSQRTALLAEALISAPAERRQEIRARLKNAANLMHKSHLGLTQGDADMGLPRDKSATIQKMYFDNPLNVDVRVKSYLQEINKIINTPDNQLTTLAPLLNNIVSLSLDTLLDSLDKIVKQYQVESEMAVNKIRTINTIAWLVTLILLVLESVFIFYPSIVQIRNYIQQRNAAKQKLIAAKEEAENANKIKSQFLSVISHELRTPLTSIKGTLSLLSNDVIKEPAKIKEMLSIALRNAERLRQLVNDILDVEKLHREGVEYHDQPVTIIELVNNAIKMEKAYADQYDVELVLEDTGCENMQLYVDPHRIQQVIANLLSNAIKYSPREQQVMIRLECHASKFRFNITNQGKPIDEAYREKIFSYFTQADASDTREKGGTGLGLAISKEIITHYNGMIDFVCSPEEGTRFYFELEARNHQ